MLENMDPRFPIGPYVPPDTTTVEQRAAWIEDLIQAPAALRAAIAGLNDEQLDTPYRDGGWTVRQLVHHLPDGHMHAYVRMKFALTEEQPAVKGYDEVKYAELPDYRLTPVEVSLALLDALHKRWAVVLRALTPADFTRSFHHSEFGQVRLYQQLGNYAWHGRHHVAHITALRDRMRW